MGEDLRNSYMQLLRLNSFKSMPLRFHDEIWPTQLANGGFFYDSQSEQTVCCFCQVRKDIYFWKGEINPIEIHKEECVLRKCSAETFENDNVETFENDNVEEYMWSERNRLLTYKRWKKSRIISPGELAKAGFFFTNSSDRVQCAFCWNVLHNWESNDVAMFEHRRHFPRCMFVLGAALRNIPITAAERERIEASFGDYGEHLNEPTTNMGYSEEVAAYYQENRRHVSRPEDIFDNIMIRKPTVSPCPQSLLPNRDIENLLKKREELRDEQLCRVCCDAESTVLFYPCGHVCCCQKCADKLTDCAVCRKVFSRKVTLRLSPELTNINNTSIDPQTLLKENEILEKRRKCKFCNSAECIVFLSCGHFYSCKACSQRLVNCEICQERIGEKVRIYYS